MVLKELAPAPKPVPIAASASSISTTAPMPTGRPRARLMQLAQERNLVVLAHVDDAAIDKLFAHAPKAPA